MIAVILTIHVLVVLALIGLVLIQRSEGGALGIGGGGGGGGFMTGRGAANALTRTTSVLAALFFTTSMGLALVGKGAESEESVLRELTSGANAPVEETAPAPDASTEDLLQSLGVDDATPPAPAADDAAPAEASGQAVNEEPAGTGAAAEAQDSAGEAATAVEDTPPAEEPQN